MSPVATETRISRYGVAVALYPSDGTLPMQIQRAPDSAGSPDTGSAEIIGIAPAGSRTYVDIAPTGATFHYRARHINEAGEVSTNWTLWVEATSAKLPDVLPNVPDIAALDRWTTDIEFSPDTTEDANAVEWTAGSVVVGNGTTYAISSGSSSTYGNGVIFWVYFDPETSATALQDTSTFSDLIGQGIIPLAICETTSDGTGELTVMPTLGLGNVNASRIFALELSAISANLGTVTAGYIQNAGNTAAIRLSGATTLPTTNYIDFTATTTAPFLQHDALALLANGSATFGGVVSATSFTGSNPVFDSTVNVEGGEGLTQHELRASGGTVGRGATYRMYDDAGSLAGEIWIFGGDMFIRSASTGALGLRSGSGVITMEDTVNFEETTVTGRSATSDYLPIEINGVTRYLLLYADP